MKNHIFVLMLFVLVAMIFSCSKKTESRDKTFEETSQQSLVDYDFSDMNYNIISAVTFDMAINPMQYYGKTIKIRGQFFSSFEEETNNRYFACLISDATECCQTGIDFILSGSSKYPKDFPQEGSQIEITGVFEDFSNIMKDDRSYAALLCNSIKILE